MFLKSSKIVAWSQILAEGGYKQTHYFMYIDSGKFSQLFVFSEVFDDLTFIKPSIAPEYNTVKQRCSVNVNHMKIQAQ